MEEPAIGLGIATAGFTSAVHGVVMNLFATLVRQFATATCEKNPINKIINIFFMIDTIPFKDEAHG